MSLTLQTSTSPNNISPPLCWCSSDFQLVLKGMCSSRGLCGGSERPANRSSRSGGSGSGSQYALCALGIGLIALGIVMIVWTVVPQDGEASETSNSPAGNSSTTVPTNNDEDEEISNGLKTSSVAYVLVGSGAVILLLSICLGVRNKRRADQRSRETPAAGVPYMDHVAGEQGAET